jgi:hypothetical protein
VEGSKHLGSLLPTLFHVRSIPFFAIDGSHLFIHGFAPS